MPDEGSQPQIRYFHGGNRGLRVGGYILPASATGAQSTSDFVDANGLHSRDKAYVTIDLKSAQLWASGHKQPTVYEVVPEGSVEDDPDCRPVGISFTCDKARIVAVHKIPGKLIKKARKVLLRNG